jgi:hypothetical protein
MGSAGILIVVMPVDPTRIGRNGHSPAPPERGGVYPTLELCATSSGQGVGRRSPLDRVLQDPGALWVGPSELGLGSYGAAMPAIVANALFIFMIAWNEFLFALLFLVEERERWTVSLGLSQLAGSIEIPTTVLMAGSVIVTIPIVVVFFASERLLTEGLTAGAEKG